MISIALYYRFYITVSYVLYYIIGDFYFIAEHTHTHTHSHSYTNIYT